MQLKHLTLIAALLGSSLSAHAASALKMDVYNPGEKVFSRCPLKSSPAKKTRC